LWGFIWRRERETQASRKAGPVATKRGHNSTAQNRQSAKWHCHSSFFFPFPRNRLSSGKSYKPTRSSATARRPPLRPVWAGLVGPILLFFLFSVSFSFSFFFHFSFLFYVSFLLFCFVSFLFIFIFSKL
jgi:hypothetical protein